MVSRAKPVAWAKAEIPPQPHSSASAAAQCRRARSSRTGRRAAYLRRSPSRIVALCMQRESQILCKETMGTRRTCSCADPIVNMTGTSGRPRVPAEAFDRYLVVVPPAPVAKAFGELASAVIAVMKQRDGESRTLAAIRDTLLPKLISGEVRVPV